MKTITQFNVNLQLIIVGLAICVCISCNREDVNEDVLQQEKIAVYTVDLPIITKAEVISNKDLSVSIIMNVESEKVVAIELSDDAMSYFELNQDQFDAFEQEIITHISYADFATDERTDFVTNYRKCSQDHPDSRWGRIKCKLKLIALFVELSLYEMC